MNTLYVLAEQVVIRETFVRVSWISISLGVLTIDKFFEKLKERDHLIHLLMLGTEGVHQLYVPSATCAGHEVSLRAGGIRLLNAPTTDA